MAKQKSSTSHLRQSSENLVRSRGGFSLVEMLVGVAIAGVLSAALASLMSTMNKENRSISDKVEALDTERQLGQLLADNILCSCQLAAVTGAAATLVADPASGTGPATSHLDLPKLTTSCDDATKIFAVPGQKIMGAPSGLIVRSIGARYLTPTGPRDSNNVPTQYAGAITIDFEPTSTGRTMKSIKTSKFFAASGDHLTGCATATGAGGAGVTVDYRQPSAANVNNGNTAATSVRSTAWCLPGFKATGGGMESDMTIHNLPNGTPCVPTAILESKAVQDSATGVWGWAVTATCQSYHAIVACVRE